MILIPDPTPVLAACQGLWRWVREEIVLAPIEPILHPSRMRLLLMGLITFSLHLIFAWLWLVWHPQPYENLIARGAASMLGLTYILPLALRDIHSWQTEVSFSLGTWINLPCFFGWMFWMNQGNLVWTGAVCAMVLIYFHLTDWRLAVLGLALAAPLAPCLAALSDGPTDWFPSGETLVTLGFSLLAGLFLGMSSANLRRTRLRHTLSAIGVMAHELRTPLATIELASDVLQDMGRQHDDPDGQGRRLQDMATRLKHVVHTMNRQIDTQIANASLQHLPPAREPIDAAELVREVTQAYPYRARPERLCVQVEVRQGFVFRGAQAAFAQVLSNLMKNALHSLAARAQPLGAGDLKFVVEVQHGRGRITVLDRGLGMNTEQRQRIFEPFYSTQSGVGSGLGLSFCRSVVQQAGGHIGVNTAPGQGATFMIDLPLDPDIQPAPQAPAASPP